MDHDERKMTSKMENNLLAAFSTFLNAASKQMRHAQWFIVDADDDDPHSLASFLHMTHEQLMWLLKGCNLTIKGPNSGSIFSSSKFEVFIKSFSPLVLEFSTLRIKNIRVNVLRIGAYKDDEKRFKFYEQTQMEQDCKRRIPRYRESKHHDDMKDALFMYLLSLVSVTEAACPPQLAANKPMPACPPQQAAIKPMPTTPPPSDKGSCCVIDTPVQLMLGASLIHETINLEKDFPYLHELGITIKTDWNIRRLQRELEKLADTIESVNLGEIVSYNDRVRTRIVVPRCKNFDVFMQALR